MKECSDCLPGNTLHCTRITFLRGLDIFFLLNLFLCLSLLRFRSFQILKVPFARKWQHFVIGEDVFFAVASNSRSHDSPIFKWNGDMFVPFQTLPTVKAFDIEPFKIGEDTYLAVAIYYGRSSHIYKWDGERFVKFQDIAAVGADVEHFKMNGSTYLAITGMNRSVLYTEVTNKVNHLITKDPLESFLIFYRLYRSAILSMLLFLVLIVFFSATTLEYSC